MCIRVCVRACVFHFIAQITFTVTDGNAEMISHICCDLVALIL